MASPGPGRRESAPHPPFLGVWNANGEPVEFSPGGGLRWNEYRGQWTAEGFTLVLHLPFVRQDTDWEMQNEDLVLRSSSFTMRPTRGLPPPLPYAEHLRSAVAELGEFEYYTAPSNEFLVKARTIADRYPDVPDLWNIIGWQCVLLGRTSEAIESSRKSLSLAPESERTVRAFAYRIQAETLKTVDPPGALRSALSAFVLSRDELFLSGFFHVISRSLTRDRVAGAIQDVVQLAEDRDVALRLLEATRQTSSKEVTETTTLHLGAIAESCGRSRAQVLFLSYPFASPRLAGLMSQVAREQGAGYLDVRRTFERLAPEVQKRMFVADGHCSDEGYDLVAQLATQEVLARLATH